MVSSSTAEIARLRVTEAARNLFLRLSIAAGKRWSGTHGRVRFPELDDSVRFLRYSMTEDVSDLIYRNFFYRMPNEWPGLGPFWFRPARQLLMFGMLPESVTKTLNIARPRPAQLEVTEIDDSGRPLIVPDPSEIKQDI